MIKLRVIGIGLLLVLSIAVDFTSRILSVVSDAVLIGGAIILLLPLLKSALK